MDNIFIRIKDKFLTYIKSKETHKIWIRRGIIVGIILLIALSFRVKEALKIFPYNEDSYLITNAHHTTLTNYTGSAEKGQMRIQKFFENFEQRNSDSVRFEYKINGYRITEDMSCDGSTTIKFTVDNTRNVMLSKDKRVKTTKEYVFQKSVEDSVRTYKLVSEDGREEIIIMEESLKKDGR